MLKVNEYYDGQVKSISLENEEGRETVSVMMKGEYEFATSSTEYMTVVSGRMKVMLPGNDFWKEYKPFETFIIPPEKKFRVLLEETAAYKCLYK